MATVLTSSAISLKIAAEVIADAAKVFSGRFSSRIPAAMKTYLGPGSTAVFISAGVHGGQWGWVPIHAWMFENYDARHPYFAKKGSWRYRHLPWYTQPYRPYMEEAAETAGQEAANVYADLEIRRWAFASHYK
jgi:hypothetical protein